MEKTYVAEYSASQDCFNIDLLDTILQKNNQHARAKESNDYQILYIGSYDNCELFIKTFEEVFR